MTSIVQYLYHGIHQKKTNAISRYWIFVKFDGVIGKIKSIKESNLLSYNEKIFYLNPNKTYEFFIKSVNNNGNTSIQSNSVFKQRRPFGKMLNFNDVNNFSNSNIINISTLENNQNTIIGDDLLSTNNLTTISTNQQQTYYTVKRGDTLGEIAEKHNTALSKLYNDNKSVIGSNPNNIKVGQRLAIIKKSDQINNQETIKAQYNHQHHHKTIRGKK